MGVYQRRIRDCYALEQSSGVPFPEWRRVVRELRALLNDASSGEDAMDAA